MSGFAKLMVFGFLWVPAVAHAKNQAQSWRAYSRTAESITGSIQVTPQRLRTSRADFPIRSLGSRRFDGGLGPTVAGIHQVTVPQNPVLLNGNRICGGPVRWIVLWKTDSGLLGMAAFDSKQVPSSTKSAGFCGSYFYSRSK